LSNEEYISSPRSIWDPDSTVETRGKRVMTLGSNTAGIVIRVTKKGIEFNGYYAGLTEPTKYCNMREFITMTWDEFDKMRQSVFLRKPVKKELVVRDPDDIDSAPDHAYLETLPIVTLNGVKYYIDAENQQRRPVEHPERVFDFETQAARKAT